MELHIVIKGRKDLANQLYDQLRDSIESGRLAAGVQLPPSRLLAVQLGLSRKTISDAYSRLTYENFLVGKRGSGTFVNSLATAQSRKQETCDLASAAVLQKWQNLELGLRHPAGEEPRPGDFIGGAVSHSHFPAEEWRRCVQHALRQLAKTPGLYSQPQGLEVLRKAIAGHIAFARGVRCMADEVVVCNGAQQALDLISRVLIEPGCCVAMEDPGYRPARLLFTAQGARVVGVPVDADGMQVDAIPEDARFIYVTPSHQMPLGMPMSVARRQALLDKARRIGAIIIEDDYDSEFRYEGQPTDSLQSMDRHGIVAYVGTFSKTLLPELRLGYAVLPSAIHAAVIKARQLTDWHTSTLNQWALAKFIDDGLLQKHIRRCHGIYAGRRDRILARFTTDLAPWFETIPATAGFHMALWCKSPMDVELLIKQARQRDIGIYSLTPYYQSTPDRAGIYLGFGAIETLDIDPALDRLRALLQTF